MKILGKLGVDIKLLIAQIINFGLLLWVLKRFLYTPIIRRIEEDERELEAAKIKEEQLEKERLRFQEQKTRELVMAHKKAEEIIAEAYHLAERIEEKAKEKLEKEINETINQSREHLKTIESALKAQLRESARKEIIGGLQQYFLNLPQQAKEGLEDFFWHDLLKQVKKIDLAHFKPTEITTELKGIEKKHENKKTKNDSDKKIVQVLSEKLGPIVLEYVHPVKENPLTDLKSLLSKKIGAKIVLARKLNKALISGFRLEVAGFIIESNLLAQINNETRSNI